MVLYINGNYPHHSLHGELVYKLAELGNDITVFVPMKGKELKGKYRCNHPKVKILYCDCLIDLDKICFLNKIQRIAKKIEEQIDIGSIESIIAGTMYSDGAVAYLLHKKHNIPFSIAVRHTDVTDHMKWRPYLNGLMKKLLNEANSIIFLSPAYEHYLKRFGDYQNKYVLIPNAVNDYWFQNAPRERTIHNPVSMIYVGELSQNKNVCTTIMTVAELKKRNVEIEFHIVGSGGEEPHCRALIKELKIEDHVYFHGWQNGKEKIKQFYDKSDIFVMTSHKETFGTVYIEALSQGLPIIYTKHQGVDGYFEEGNVGYGCDPNDIIDIANRIQQIIDNYQSMSKQCLIISNMFTWEKVAGRYNQVIHCMGK